MRQVVTSRETSRAWSERSLLARSGSAEGLPAARKANDLRNLFTKHSLVSAVKGAIAMRYRDENWARIALPGLPLAVDVRGRLWEAFAARLAAA
jgi:hypothetical protein